MNVDFGKTVENVRKNSDIKVATIERRNYLVSEPNFHTTNFFTENLLATEMKKTEIYINLSIQDRFTQVYSGSVQVQILLVTCQRFAMVRISDNGPDWK